MFQIPNNYIFLACILIFSVFIHSGLVFIHLGYLQLPDTTESKFQFLMEKVEKIIINNLSLITISFGALTLIFLIISCLSKAFAYWNDKIPTNAELNFKQAKSLFNQKYKCTLNYKSIRTEDVAWIKDKITRKILPDDQEFAVVVGPKGVGKTTSVETAADDLPGVIIIQEVRPGTNKDEIMKRVFNKIKGTLQNTDTEERALSVLKEYKEISGGKSPIIIISADQRDVNDKPAELTATGRTLTKYGFNVLIDASENAMPNSRTDREIKLEMKELSNLDMQKLPQFAKLLTFLKDTGHDLLILAICGGCPQTLKKLSNIVKLEDTSITNDEKKVRNFIDQELSIAYDNTQALASSSSLIKTVCVIFYFKFKAYRLSVHDFTDL
jgi:hypothetical protein